MFTPEMILEKVKRQPFTPLRFSTSDGEHYDIVHPDMAMVGRRDVYLGLASKKEPRIYDRAAWIAIMHITAIEELSLPQSAPKNGAS